MTLQPVKFSAADPAAKAKLTARTVVRQRFNELRLQAAALLEEADKIASCGLSEVEVQQARAAAKLAGAQFFSLPVMATEEDFLCLREDLLHVAFSVDPLILAIGADAKNNSHEISKGALRECFEAVIFTAIDGNATHLLDQCAKEARERMMEGADA